MTNFDELASTPAFIAGRAAARSLSDTGAGPDDGRTHLPRGLHSEDERAWLRGWDSLWS